MSVTDAMAAARDFAAEVGYSVAEGDSGPTRLVFKKGASLFSWGSTFTLDFDEVSASETKVTIDTHEPFMATDWGRGKRAAARFLEALGTN